MYLKHGSARHSIRFCLPYKELTPFLFHLAVHLQQSLRLGFIKFRKYTERQRVGGDADLSLFLENYKTTGYYEVLTIFQGLLCFTNINSSKSHNTQTVSVVCYIDEETEAHRVRKSPKGLCESDR